MATSGGTRNPFKVTDPTNPRFDPAKFKFEDYPYPDPIPLRHAIRSICDEEGEPLSSLDTAFVESGGAVKSESQRHVEGEVFKHITYDYPPGPLNPKVMPTNINVAVDESDRVISCMIGAHGSTIEAPNYKRFKKYIQGEN